MRILIIGRTEILYESARLLSKGHDICGMITARAVPEYRMKENDFESLAKTLGCPYLLTQKLDEHSNRFIRESKPDIGISLNWVSIISGETLELFPKGVLNAHFADLPRFRGNAVVNWALILGEKKIPLTIHYMTAGELDSGDILLQEDIPVNNTTTVKDIYDAALEKVPAMFGTVLRKIEDGTLEPSPQDLSGKKAFRCYPRLPNDSKIDWSLPAHEIDLLVRASAKPFTGAYSYITGHLGAIKKVYIWKSRVILNRTDDVGTPGHIIKNDPQSGESWVYTGNGIIALSSVSYGNGPEFNPGEKWKSIRVSFGTDVEDELIEIQNALKKIKNEIGLKDE